MISPTIKTVFMDESGNKETDRFFVTGFLELENVITFNQQLYRIHDQILHLSRYKRLHRVNKAKQDNDLETLFNFAKYTSSFELKFDRITSENIHFFEDLIKGLMRKCSFRFTAIVVDRKDPYYVHDGLYPMYKLISNIYSHYCIKQDYIFVPDMFDHRFNWYDINHSPYLKVIIPTTSDSSFPLQVVDILTGTIGLGLRFKYLEKDALSKSDYKRKTLIDILQRELKRNIQKNLTVNTPNYFSIWTIDFSKRRGF